MWQKIYGPSLMIFFTLGEWRYSFYTTFTNFVGRLFHSFILVTLIVRCDYLEICVEHHDFLRGYEEINLRAWLGLTLGCLETSTHSRRKKRMFWSRDWMGAVIKTWGMKTCSGLMKPACLNGFDVETNLSNQSFTARAWPKWEMVYLRSDMKC